MKSLSILSSLFLILASGTAWGQVAIGSISLQGSASSFTPSGGEDPVVDETPDVYSLTAQTGVVPGDVAISNTVTVSGIDASVTASVSGDGSPQIRVNGGGLTASGSVSNGDTVVVSLATAAGAYGASYTATLTIGTASADFVATTSPAGPEACHDPANAGAVGQVGWTGCEGMLIVSNAMLSGASSATAGGNASFAIAGPDGNTYTFADSAFNIFTGQVTSLANLFYQTSFNGDIGYWDTSNVTTMFNLFRDNSAFNQPIENWDTSNVTMMNNMFRAATAFNRNLSGWCVSNIPAKPGYFDTIASSWSLPRPVWGTCPSP